MMGRRARRIAGDGLAPAVAVFRPGDGRGVDASSRVLHGRPTIALEIGHHRV